MCYEDLRNFMEAGFLKVAAENPGSGPIEMVNLLNYEAGFDSFDKSKACWYTVNSTVSQSYVDICWFQQLNYTKIY